MARRRTWRTGQLVPPSAPGGTWGVRWPERGKRPFRGGFRSKVEAQKALAKAVGAVASERSGVPPDHRSLPALDALATEWLKRRENTHRSWRHDRGRWRHHLAPHFGSLRAPQVGTAEIRAFVEAELRAGVARTTIGLGVRCLSTFFSDLCERPRETGATSNPVAGLPRSLRRLYRSDHDPRFTPYIQRLPQVVALFQSMPEPQRVAYAIGVVAGLRPGEILALDWTCVDEAAHRIDVVRQVQNGRAGPTKDDEARIVQGAFLAPLVAVLKAWRVRTGGRGLLFPPSLTRTPGKRTGAFMHPKRLAEGLATGAAAAGMPEIVDWQHPFYSATRHTMATHWVRAGHAIGELAIVLGHSTTWVTERYAHIRPGPRDGDPWTLDLLRAPAGVETLKEGQKTGSQGDENGPDKAVLP